MRDRPLIYAGLAVFVALITFPISYNRAAGTTSAAPALQKPAKGDRCIYPAEFMRASHMNVLTEWRDQVVRANLRLVTIGGKTYTMSLTGTCLECHTSKAEFCDKCHDYAGVKPYCWDCHIDPALLKRASPLRAARTAEGGSHAD
jgi:hypothetical protein